MRSQHTHPVRIDCTMVSATLRRRSPVHMIGGPCIAVTALPSFDSSDKRASVLGALLLQVTRLALMPDGKDIRRAAGLDFK